VVTQQLYQLRMLLENSKLQIYKQLKERVYYGTM